MDRRQNFGRQQLSHTLRISAMPTHRCSPAASSCWSMVPPAVKPTWNLSPPPHTYRHRCSGSEPHSFTALPKQSWTHSSVMMLSPSRLTRYVLRKPIAAATLMPKQCKLCVWSSQHLSSLHCGQANIYGHCTHLFKIAMHSFPRIPSSLASHPARAADMRSSNLPSPQRMLSASSFRTPDSYPPKSSQHLACTCFRRMMFVTMSALDLCTARPMLSS